MAPRRGWAGPVKGVCGCCTRGLAGGWGTGDGISTSGTQAKHGVCGAGGHGGGRVGVHAATVAAEGWQGEWGDGEWDEFAQVTHKTSGA